MPRTAVLLALLALAPVAASAYGTGEATRSLELSGFSAVVVKDGIGVDISRGERWSVVVTADGSVLDRISIEAAGGTLTIAPRNVRLPRTRWLVNRAWVVITLPYLASLEASGGSEARVAMGTPGRDVRLAISGGSLLGGTVACRALELVGSGAGAADLAGRAASLRLAASGGFRARLASLEVEDVVATLSGGSTATVTATASLSVSASGGSGLTYGGTPRIDRRELSGGSWLRAR